jgi:hypothetical protein
MATTPLHGWPLPLDEEQLLEIFLRARLLELDSVTGINTAVPVSVTGATALTSSAFYKLHVCTGTAADYTLTLPTPTSADVGKLISFRMDNALTVLVTLDAGATRTIGASQTRVCRRGDVVTLLCVGISGACWAVVGVAAEQLPSARVFHTSAQAIPNNTFTALNFGSERWDSAAMHDTVTNNSRITCRVAGEYDIGASVHFAANATGNRFVLLRLNGVTSIGADGSPNFGASQTAYLNTATRYRLAVGDYIEVVVYQDSGGSLNTAVTGNISPEFWLSYVGG